MKFIFKFLLLLYLIFIFFNSKVNASEIQIIKSGSLANYAEEIAEKFCSAKADNFFEGLENEKTLKYSYFKYIGIQGREKFLKDIYDPLIDEIREKCSITNEEERELNQFFQNEYSD